MSTAPAGCSVVTTALKPGAEGAGDKAMGPCREGSWIQGHSLKVRILEEIHSQEQDKLGKNNLSTKAVVKRVFCPGLGSSKRF